MIKCQQCGKEIAERDGLVHTDMETKVRSVICRECFKEQTGVDYQTFQYRKESAHQGCFAVIFCLLATIYVCLEKGLIYGGLGLVATILIYFFAIKVK